MTSNVGFKDIIAISGKRGLFRLIKPTRNGLLLETLDEKRIRTIRNIGISKIISLDNVAIYTNKEIDAVPLEEVFKLIGKKNKDEINLNKLSHDEEVRSFMKNVMPDYDEDRVHPSQILKLISWYNIILKEIPDLILSDKEIPKKSKSTQKSQEGEDKKS